MNLVMLMGNIVKDLELRYLPNGTACLDFTIAVNKRYKDKQEVSYFDCTAFGKTAEIINEHMGKGSPILVEGELQQSRWEKEGKKFSKVKVIVNRFHFVGKKEKQENKPEIMDEVPF